jgi:hypothetical protein
MPDRATMSARNFRLIFDIFFCVAFMADSMMTYQPSVKTVLRTMSYEFQAVHSLASILNLVAVRTFIFVTFQILNDFFALCIIKRFFSGRFDDQKLQRDGIRPLHRQTLLYLHRCNLPRCESSLHLHHSSRPSLLRLRLASFHRDRHSQLLQTHLPQARRNRRFAETDESGRIKSQAQAFF